MTVYREVNTELRMVLIDDSKNEFLILRISMFEMHVPIRSDESGNVHNS